MPDKEFAHRTKRIVLEGNALNLSTRQVTVFRQLLLKRSVTHEELAGLCACSTKTIQRDLSKISSFGEGVGFSIVRVGRHEVALECTPEVRQHLTEVIFESDAIYGDDTVGNRRSMIYLGMLLDSPNATSIAELAERYYVGSSSIVNDLQSISNRAAENGITLAKTLHGTFLVGDEADIRNEIANVLAELYPSSVDGTKPEHARLNDATWAVLARTYGQERLGQVEECVGSIEESIGIILGDIYYVNIVTHILIAIERVKNNRCIESEDVLSEEERRGVIYQKVAECVSELSKKTGITLPENEVRNIYMHFKGCGVGELPDQEVVGQLLQGLDDLTVGFTDQLVKDVRTQTGIDIPSDSHLMNSLLLHVSSMLKRIEFGVRIVCLIKDQVESEYESLYETVGSIARKLLVQCLPDRILTEDEACYLCMYFAAALEERHERVRVVLVCSTGIGTSKLLEKRIETVFPDLEVADVLSLRQLKRKDLSEISLVITTTPITFPIQCESVLVSVFLNQQDVFEVREHLRTEMKMLSNMSTGQQAMGTHVLDASSVLIGMGARSRNVALRMMAEQLVSSGAVADADALLDAIDEREKLGGSGIGMGIAIPHGISDTVRHPCLGIATTRSPIEWEAADGRPVDLIVMFAVNSLERSDETESISKVIGLLADSEVTERLRRSASAPELITVLEKALLEDSGPSNKGAAHADGRCDKAMVI